MSTFVRMPALVRRSGPVGAGGPALLHVSPAAIAFVAVASLAAAAASARLAPGQLLLFIGLVAGYTAGVPGALLTIAVPIRTTVPVLHSISWCDAAIVGAFVAEMHRGAVIPRFRWRPAQALVLLACLSLAFSVSRAESLRALLLLLQGSLLGFASYSYVKRSRRNRDTFFVAWLGLGLFSALASFVLFYLSHPSVWWNLQPPANRADLVAEQLRLGSPFWGPSNYYASILFLFVPMCWTAFYLGYRRAFAAVAGAVMAVALFVTTSRGAIFAAVVAAVYFGVRALRRRSGPLTPALRRRRWLTVRLMAVVVAPVLIFGRALVNYFFLSRDLSVGSLNGGGRGAILSEAFALAPSHVIVGAGFGASSRLAPLLAHGTHVYALTLFLELGLVGLLLGVASAVRTLRTLGRAVSTYSARVNAATAILCAGFGSLVFTLADVQVEASFEGVVFFWLFGALMGATCGAVAALARD